MTGSWHPAIRADWLVLRRTGAGAFLRMIAAPVLLSGCCAALACGDFHDGYGWCLAAGALLALGGSYVIAHRRLLDATERWRFGWCGALPAARGATTSTLLLASVAALVVSLAFITVLLFAVSVSAPHHADFVYAVAGIDLALVVGTVAAVMRVFHSGVLARSHQADGVGEPLLALAWLNDARLPHLLDWQRRAALVRWRRGGSPVMVGIVLGVVPIGAPMAQVAGLVLLVLAWSWLAVVMRASADAFAAAVRLLAAVPWDVRSARLASLRYPLIAVSCALVCVAAGTALLRHGGIALAWVACAAVVSARPFVRLARATRSVDPRA